MILLPCRFARRGFFLLIICKKYGPAMVRIVERRGDLTVLYFGLAAVRQHCGHFYFCSAN